LIPHLINNLLADIFSWPSLFGKNWKTREAGKSHKPRLLTRAIVIFSSRFVCFSPGWKSRKRARPFSQQVRQFGKMRGVGGVIWGHNGRMIHGPGALDFLVCCFSISRHSLEAEFLASLAFLARSSHLFQLHRQARTVNAAEKWALCGKNQYLCSENEV